MPIPKPFGRAHPSASNDTAGKAGTAEALATNDRRQEPRISTSVQGKICFGGGATVLDCVILDLSDGGARVRSAPGDAIPDRFILVRLRDFIAHEVRVVWRRDKVMIGVKFENTHDLDQAKSPGMRALRQLCLGR